MPVCRLLLPYLFNQLLLFGAAPPPSVRTAQPRIWLPTTTEIHGLATRIWLRVLLRLTALALGMYWPNWSSSSSDDWITPFWWWLQEADGWMSLVCMGMFWFWVAGLSR